MTPDKVKATSKRLPWAEVEKLAEDVRSLLADPDAGLTEQARRRWEGALAALEVVLGERESSLL